MSSRKIRAGRAEVDLGLRDRMSRGLKMAAAKLRSFAAGATQAGAMVGAAGTAITGTLFGSAKAFAAAGDQLDKMNIRTGISVKRLSELGFAASRGGTDIGAIEKGAQGMARFLLNAEKGLTTATDTLDEFGLSVADFAGLNPDERFDKFADAISKVEDPTKRAALAMRVFGKSGASLIPVFADGKKGLDEMAKEAERLGLVFDDTESAAAAKLTDAFGDMGATIKGVFLELGAAVAGPLTEFINLGAGVLAVVREWIKANSGLVLAIGGLGVVLTALGGALVTIGTTAFLASFALSALAGVVGVITSPFGLLVAGLAAASVGFLMFTETGGKVVDWFTSNFGGLVDIVRDTVGGIWDALTSGDLELAAKIGFTGLKLAISTILESVASIFGTSMSKMFEVVGKLFKEIGRVVAKLNTARVGATNFLAQGLASLLRDKKTGKVAFDVTPESRAASRQAANFAKGIEQFDAKKFGEDLTGSFDPESLRSELEALNNQAAKQRKEVEADKLKAKDPIGLPDLEQKAEAIKKKFQNFSGLSGSKAARQGPGAVAMDQKQLKEMEKTNEKLDLTNDLLKDIAPQFG